MSIGALVALYLKEEKKRVISLLCNPISQILSIFILVSPLILDINIYGNLEIELYAIASIIWIVNTVINEKSFISVRSGILRYFGKISYGIYVYHLIIIYIISMCKLNLHIILTYSLIILCVTVIATISFEFLEKSFIKFKKNYITINSRG